MMLGVPEDADSRGGQDHSPPSDDLFRWMEREDDLISAASDSISLFSDEPEAVEDVKPVITVDDSDSDEEATLVNRPVTPGKRPAIEGTASSPTKRSRNESSILVARGELAATNCYREHFASRHHHNLVGRDQVGEAVLLSLIKEEESHYRVMVWQSSGTWHKLIPTVSLGANPTLTALAEHVCEQVKLERFMPVACPRDSRLISLFEEETLTKKFKFLILMQKAGPLVDKFLSVLGQRVQKQDKTDVYTVFRGRDIKLRVATMSCGGLERASAVVVFHKEGFSFPPTNDNIHTTIFVSPLNLGAYEVTVATQDNDLVLRPLKFSNSDSMKEFVLTKLIEVEIASTASQKRTPLLRKLISELEQQSQDFIGSDHAQNLDTAIQTGSTFKTKAQEFLDRSHRLKKWAGALKDQITAQGSSNGGARIEEQQEVVRKEFSAFHQLGTKVLQSCDEAYASIQKFQKKVRDIQFSMTQHQATLLQEIQSQTAKRESSDIAPELSASDNVAGTSKTAPSAPKEPTQKEGTLSYEQLLTKIKDEWKWIKQQRDWLAVKASDAHADFVEFLLDQHDGFDEGLEAHQVSCRDVCEQVQLLPNGTNTEKISQHGQNLCAWLKKLQELAAQQRVDLHARISRPEPKVSIEAGPSNVSTQDSTASATPMMKLAALDGFTRHDKATLWTGAFHSTFSYFCNISDSTVAKMIEISGFFVDHVAKMARQNMTGRRIQRSAIEKLIEGDRYRVFHEIERPKRSSIGLPAIRKRFVESLPGCTQVEVGVYPILHELISKFAQLLIDKISRKNFTEKIEFDQVDRALTSIGFGFLIRPEVE